jgi:hypothetical protein
MIFTFTIFLSGMVAYFVMRYYKDAPWTKDETWIKFVKVHRIFGYVTLIINTVACCGGFITYAY